MTAFHLFKPIAKCKICGIEIDYGSMCGSCRHKLRKEKLLVKKNYE